MKHFRDIFNSTILTVIFGVLWVFSVMLFAPISETIRLTAVFDYDDSPIDGIHTVVVRFYLEDTVVYKEVVEGVEFFQGVGYIDIGGTGSDLINDIFYAPDMDVGISVLQHQIRFPFTSIPYTIRALESNTARRVDNEALVKFLENEHRVGVLNESPEVTFDINGALRVRAFRSDETASDGVIYWSGIDNVFYGYSEDEWVSLSYSPDERIRSKGIGIGLSAIVADASVDWYAARNVFISGFFEYEFG